MTSELAPAPTRAEPQAATASQRPRRLRRSPALRALVRETRLHPKMLIAPLFVQPGVGRREPIASMPGVARLSPDVAADETARLAALGVGGVILPADSSLTVSGAACRVAEGGAEVVPLARPEAAENMLSALRNAGFAIAATVPRGGVSPYAQPLPARIAFVFGAENEGMSAPLIAAADHRLTIPGTGEVESLNIAASAAVLFAEHYRLHGAPR